MHSTLPRSKKEISHPSLTKDDNFTAKSAESDATDHKNFRDEVYLILCNTSELSCIDYCVINCCL